MLFGRRRCVEDRQRKLVMGVTTGQERRLAGDLFVYCQIEIAALECHRPGKIAYE